MHIRLLLGSAALSTMAILAPAAQAQEAPPPSEGFDEIVITAQKREQRLQDVPVAVTAVTAETLDQRGIDQVADLTRVAPALTITQSQNPQSSTINLRGIGTFAFGIGIEPAVSVVVDDVALLQQAQAFTGLTDIARIEVLRGPQGTLFGKNASAGVINIVSQAPTENLTASFGTSYTTDDQFRMDGSVSGQAFEGVRARANVFYDKKQGYIHNLTTGNDLGASEAIGARVRFDIAPAPGVDLSLSALYSRDESSPTRTWRQVDPATRIFPAGAANPGSLVLPALTGVPIGPGNFVAKQNLEPRNVSEQAMYVGRASIDLGFADLISVSSYQDWNFRSEFDDADYTDLPVVAFRADGIEQGGTTHSRQFTQELRLASPGGQTFDYIAGVYYSDGKSDRDFERKALGPGASKWTGGYTTTTYAAFAQGTLNISDTTHVDGGLRWNREKITANFTNLIVPATPPANNATCLATCLGEARDDEVTYKLALRQDLTSATMVYASYATGYKGQGFDLGSGATPDRIATPVRPEYSKAYEVGLKGAFFNRRVLLNLTGFWTDYKDFQAQSARVLPGGVLDFRLNNVGKLRSRGVEAELSVMPTAGLRLDAVASYTDAKISEFANANCYTGQPLGTGQCVGASSSTGVQDLSGSRLANAPEFKYTLAASYERPISGSGTRAFIQGDWTHQSSVNYDLLGNPNNRQSAFGIFNGSLGIAGDRDTYRLTFFVNNLFDQEYASSIFVAQGDSNGLAYQQVLPRAAKRYFGVRLRLRYAD